MENKCYKHYINKCAPDVYRRIVDHTAPVSNLTISANLMVKNEEDCVERCLHSIIPCVDEVVVVDTGSTDRTVELIKNFNSPKIKLYHNKWEDDFSLIRNYMLKKSACDVIFSIDADEFLDEGTNIVEIRETISHIISIFEDTVVISLSMVDSIGNKYDTVARIFKNSCSFYYYGYVHEELRVSRNVSLHSVSLNITLHHDGYEEEKIISKNKGNRNINLLRKTLQEESSNFRWHYFLMRDLLALKKFDDELLQLVRKCLEKVQDRDENAYGYSKPVYVYAILIFRHFGKISECQNVIELLNKTHPNDIDCLYLNMLIINNKLSRNIEEAEKNLYSLKSINSLDSILNVNKEQIIIEYFLNCFQLVKFYDFFPLLHEVNDCEKQLVFTEIRKMIKTLESKYSRANNQNDCQVSNICQRYHGYK